MSIAITSAALSPSRCLRRARIELPCATTTTRSPAAMAGAISSRQTRSTRARQSWRHSVAGSASRSTSSYRRSEAGHMGELGSSGGGGTSNARRHTSTCSSPCKAAVSALLSP
eukprot:Amastigsp_a842879_16.p3 type:complete len:113 gc:universal Amastigsp_a842879_16:677-339(-)